jgi:hypothetical protein
MPQRLDLDYLKKAVAGTAAAFRCVTELQPAGGEGDKVFPPTYEGGKYAFEARLVPGREEAVPCVLLDSVQSQANRMELALLDAWRAGLLPLPVVTAAFPAEPARCPPSPGRGLAENFLNAHAGCEQALHLLHAHPHPSEGGAPPMNPWVEGDAIELAHGDQGNRVNRAPPRFRPGQTLAPEGEPSVCCGEVFPNPRLHRRGHSAARREIRLDLLVMPRQSDRGAATDSLGQATRQSLPAAGPETNLRRCDTF